MHLKDIAVKVEGVWLPKGEQHMLEWMTCGKKAFRKEDKITYQWWKQEAAMEAADEYMSGWKDGVFVDVGGHCGFWSMWWGQKMSGIVAYEPIPKLRVIYEANVRANGIDWENVSLLPLALADQPGELTMKFNPANTGATRVYADGEDPVFTPIPVTVETIDRTLPEALGVRKMSVLKIDCEGFEEKVVLGALECIKEHRPMIVVEQKFEDRHFGFKKDGAVALLMDNGYAPVTVISGDHIMVPKENIRV